MLGSNLSAGQGREGIMGGAFKTLPTSIKTYELLRYHFIRMPDNLYYLFLNYYFS